MEWIVFYIIGIMFLIVGSAVAVYKRKNSSVVLYLLASIFFTLFIWYIPIETSKDIYSIPEGILSAFLQSIGSLKGDGYVKDIVQSGWIYTFYSTSIMILRIAIFPLIFSVVLLFFKTPYQLVVNSFQKYKKTYILIGMNTKNISIAKSIHEKGPCRLIFISEKGKAESLQESLNEIDALVFEKSIRYVWAKVVKDKKIFSEENPIEVFIFDESEEKNLRNLQEIGDIVAQDKYRNSKIYVESENLSWTNQNGIQKQFEEKTKIIINFIRVHEAFALNNLYNNNLLNESLSVNGIETIKVLLVGMDNYGMATLKCILWLVQLPGYKLEICTIDSGQYIDKFTNCYPEIKMEMDEPGVALYKIEMYENVDYQSKEFTNIINTQSDFTFAFLNGSDMSTNSNLVDVLSTIRARNKSGDNFNIHMKNDVASIFADILTYPWNHVTEVGTISEVYSFEFLTNSSIEKAARLVHEERQLHKEKKTSWKSYCKDEYRRNSVFARVLSLRYKLTIIKSSYKEEYSLLSTYEWKKSEHMRWNVYTWLLGFVRGDVSVSESESEKKIAKVHADLIAFDDLELETQNNDAIDVNDNIVQQLLF